MGQVAKISSHLPDTAFPGVVRVGKTLYVGCQAASGGGIEEQTATAFASLAASLERAGASMADLVNLRTYYVYPGEDGPTVTEYWNRMTAVRLETIADPGPAATAVRVAGVPGPDDLIGPDGIATLDPDRQRIMPEHAWDWTIPTPLSQGWRVGDTVYVGGQISADRQGKAQAVGDVAAQTRNVLDYIFHVLTDAGQSWADVVAMRICYSHGAGAAQMASIVDTLRDTLHDPRPALTAFGVDLLYEGLLLEIDAIARRGAKQAVSPAGAIDWLRLDGFPAACLSGNELHVGGLSAPGGASLHAQVEASFARLSGVLAEGGYDTGDLAKLTLFYVPGPDPAAEGALIMELAREQLPPPGPVVTLLAVPGLPHDGQRFQIDGIAVHNPDRQSIPARHGETQ